jgi:hypothetical protein
MGKHKVKRWERMEERERQGKGNGVEGGKLSILYRKRKGEKGRKRRNNGR